MCMRAKGAMVALIVFGSLCFMPFTVKAQEQLPVITRWENGSGYDADGQKIAGTWAYDSVNEAVEGKYVQFDETGTVLQKAKKPEAGNLEENYTPTEQEPAHISLRVEVFDGFEGTVVVTLAEAGGITKQCELTPENYYGCNVPVNSGVYAIQSVEAYDGNYLYETACPAEQYELSEQETILLKIRVTNEQKGRVSERKDNLSSDGRDTCKEIKTEGGQEKMSTEKQRWVYAVGASGFAVLLVSWLALHHKKRNRYD